MTHEQLNRTEAETYFDNLVHERRLAGRKTYGGGLEHTDPRYDWNRMALEEALDLGQYLAARNRQLMDLLKAEPLPCPFHSDGKHRCVGCGDIA